MEIFKFELNDFLINLDLAQNELKTFKFNSLISKQNEIGTVNVHRRFQVFSQFSFRIECYITVSSNFLLIFVSM